VISCTGRGRRRWERREMWMTGRRRTRWKGGCAEGGGEESPSRAPEGLWTWIARRRGSVPLVALSRDETDTEEEMMRVDRLDMEDWVHEHCIQTDRRCCSRRNIFVLFYLLPTVQRWTMERVVDTWIKFLSKFCSSFFLISKWSPLFSAATPKFVIRK
jgi:hypothetical protein